jgi:hypothetical protein
MTVAAGLLLGVLPSAAATADPSPAAGPPAAGKKICAISDAKLGEISGIAATGTGYLVVNSAVSDQPASHQKIFSISSACKVASKVGSYGGDGPHSPQDIVRGKDGTIWVADTGDAKDRSNIALWKVSPTLSAPAQLFRFAYPAGDRHEAKAMLVNGDGKPIIITFETDRTALIYVPDAAPSANAIVPLRQAGKIDILPTATENVFGGIGHKGFNGGAVSPDGTKVVLRTQADAYEWDVSDGDVLAALKTQPRVTGLPMEPISEAITFSADGATLVTVTRLDLAKEADSEVTAATLLSYTPTTKSYVAPATVKAAAGDGWFTRWWKNLTLQQAYLLLAGIGFVGVILVLVGVVGMVKGRKKRAKAAAAAKKARKREEQEGFGGGDNSQTAVLAPVYGGGGYDDPRGGFGYQQPPPPQPDPWGGRGGGGYAEPGWSPAPQQPQYGDPYGRQPDHYGQPDQYGQPDPWGDNGGGHRGY